MARAPVRTARTISVGAVAPPAVTPIKKEKREIDVVAAEIKKRFGEQAIVRGSDIRQPWRIPTGIFMLDLATCGGIPHNQLTMLHGPRSSGKTTVAEKCIAGAQASMPDMQCAFVDLEHCVAWDSEIIDVRTGRLYSAEEVFEGRIPITTAAFDEATGRLVETQMTGWADNGKKPLYRVATGNTHIKVTGNHPVLVYAGKGKHEWVRADDLEVGMLICRPRHVDTAWGDDTFPARQARLIGYLIGDGCFSEDHGVAFFNIDPYGVQDVRELAAEMGVGMVQSKALLNAEYTYRLGTKIESGERWNRNPIRALINELGLGGLTSGDKFIPERIMAGSAQAAGEVLSGLYMTDGCVHTHRPSISFTTTSRKLMCQVRHLWARFGIVARMHEVDDQNPRHQLWYSLTINGRKNLKAVDKVLRLGGKRHDQLQHWIGITDGNNKPTIGYYLPEYAMREQRARRKWAISYRNKTSLYWEMIEDIALCEDEQTYDFSVEGLGNFLINDVVVHNTRSADWAAKLGVNNDDLLYVQPDTGENAVDMVDAIIRSKEVSLVVLDSIAAMVSNKEIEESADDNATPGLQAKLITRMCRRITNALFTERVRGHYVTLLVLNQQRSAIGKWAPHGQEALGLPGGKALEFTTMLQAGIKNKENLSKDKDGFDMLDYNEHSFKLDKCKMVAGIRSGEFQLMRRDHDTYNLFEGDIDDAETMLAHAKKIGCYSGGGRSWKLDVPGCQHTFGNLEEAIIFLYENPAEYWALRTHLIADHAARLKLPPYFIEYLRGGK